MNWYNLKESKNKVFNIPELNKAIISELRNGRKRDKAALMFVSKNDYNAFKSSVPNEEEFNKFLIEYCDEKLTTNPRWAYYAYKCKGISLLRLDNYKEKAIEDIPWKYAIAVSAISTVINFLFRRINNRYLLMPAVLTAFYFLCVHVLTLIILFKFNSCTNVKGLFRNMAIIMIFLNLMVNITNTI